MTDNSHQLDNINPHTGTPYKERPNKTALKREMKVLHELGQKLVELPNTKLSQITLSERMLDAVTLAKKLKKSALQRQLRYISGIMSEEDVETIQTQLKQLALPHQQEVELFHKMESLRDKLISGDNELINELVDTLQADRQYLRQLIRNTAKEAKQNKPPKSSRLLFKYLNELHQDS